MTSEASIFKEDQEANVTSHELARLRHARLVTVPESGRRLALSEEMVRKVSGGEEVFAREFYHQGYVYRPNYTLVFYGSDRLKIRSQGDAIWSRLLYRAVTATFPKPSEEGNVENYWDAMLAAEGDQILGWVLRGRDSSP
ncbi:phage/plasmid primase, P4 family, partial [mine drainage metagenome]